MGTSAGYSWPAAEDEKFSSRESDAINRILIKFHVMPENTF